MALLKVYNKTLGFNGFDTGPKKKQGFTVVLIFVQRKSNGVTMVLLWVQRNNTGSIMALLRVKKTKHWFYNGFA